MLVEYIWLDALGNTRSKTRVIETPKGTDEKKNVEIPLWNFDGSSTGQADSNKSEIIIHPVAAFPDPFRGGDCIMALCETLNADMSPHKSNTRHIANDVFEKHKLLEPLYGIEQEFFLEKNGTILAFSDPDNQPAPQGNYYCGTGEHAHGRNVIDAAFKRCMIAGLTVTGFNAEVAPSQWEIQVCASGINAADQLIMLRYILNRTAESFNVSVNYHPKPLSVPPRQRTPGHWNGSGCHVNFSTKSMRDKDGLTVIQNAIKNLEGKHSYHMEHYGRDNKLRMTGQHETSSFDTFTHGVADRGASVRIPHDTFTNKAGYLEDRRPASNMDPYVVTRLIMETCVE